jgi:glyoxylase-like metal-dependent hydrolase (beta-lactamase superfamily II)
VDTIDFKTTMSFRYGEPDPMAPGVVRLVAPNPSPFTFKGTNTYLVGTTSLAVIDPGPEDIAHRAAILAAAAGRPITHILITHAHRDHSDGAAGLAQTTGAPVLGFGRATAGTDARTSSAHMPSGKEFVDHQFTPDIRLADGDIVEGADWSLEAQHTPGHAPDHVCFALKGHRIVFSGDHVMAWNTTVIAPPEGRMSDYIASLEKLLNRRDRLYLPGHGGRMEKPLRAVKAYLVHRQWREQAILAAIRDGAVTIPDVVARVYATIDRRLIRAAELSVLAHVEYLADRRLVTCDRPLSLDLRFSPA